MEIIYRPVQPDDYDNVRQLLIGAGWQKLVLDPTRFDEMIRGASRTVGAFEGERIIGFAKALFDGSSNGYISTVAVAEDKQRQGIGRELVRKLMDVDEPEKITWVLRSGKGSDEFWEKIGFKKSDIAMEIVRSE